MLKDDRIKICSNISRCAVIVLTLALTTGCAPTMRQRSNLVDALNGRLTPVSYNKSYVMNAFGPPDSKTPASSVTPIKEIWTYGTTMAGKDTIFVRKKAKERRMKITIVDNIVTAVDFE